MKAYFLRMTARLNKKSKQTAKEAIKQGLIVQTHNRFYRVLLDENVYLCSPKGIFRQAAEPEYRLPVIGDRVNIGLLNKRQKGVEGYILKICRRDNVLIRADAEGNRNRVMAANLDRILVVSGLSRPGLDFGLIDRYCLTCELAGIPYHLLINKTDLGFAEKEEQRLAVYRQVGISVLMVCAKTEKSLEPLTELTGRGISFLTGTSGVGKSTLINALVPDAQLTIGEVDPKKGRGRHTTTHSTLVSLGNGAFLADSPGLRDFYPPMVEPEQVRFGFREIREAQARCRFSTCLHHQEPDCAVREQFEEGVISSFRYKSYLFLLGEMKTHFQKRFS